MKPVAARAPVDTGQPRLLVPLIEELMLTAFKPGKKDTADNLERLRFGWALWDTDEGEGGYLGQWAQFDAANGKPTQYQVGASAAAVEGHLAEVAFSRDYARFGLNPAAVGVGDDFEAAFLGLSPEINLLSAQNAIWSAKRLDPAGDSSAANIVDAGLPKLTGAIAPVAALHGIGIAQNIGFANAPLFPTGEFDFGLERPMVHQFGGIPSTFVYDVGTAMLKDGDPSLPVLAGPYWYAPANITHPEVADLVVDGIRQRLDAYAPGNEPVYSVVGGEFLIGTRFQCNVGTEECDNEAYIQGCESFENEQDYFSCLPLGDYSTQTLEHFRAWLQREVGTLAALESRWNAVIDPACVDIESCDLSPLNPPVPVGPEEGDTLQAIYRDWIAFLEEQVLLEAWNFQYNAAKSHRSSARLYRLERDADGVERSALYSDGVGCGDWFGPDAAEFEPTTETERINRHALSYGESMHYPIFGLPYHTDSTGGPVLSADPACPEFIAPKPSMMDWAPFYRPACHNRRFSKRMLLKMAADGVDSIGAAYWEVGGNFAGNCGVLPSMVADFAEDFAELQEERLGMHPWRSPMLVHSSNATTVPHNPIDLDLVPESKKQLSRNAHVAFTKNQLQFSSFSMLEGLDDLWMPSQRKVCVSTFAPALDQAAIDRLILAAETHGWSLLILTDSDTFESLSGDPVSTGPLTFKGYPIGETFSLPTPNGQPLWSIYSFFTGLDPALQAAVDQLITEWMQEDLASLLEAVAVDPVCPIPGMLRPVRFLDESGEILTEGIEVSVMNDGLNYLVHVGSTTESADVRIGAIEVVADPGAPLCGFDAPRDALAPGPTGAVSLPLVLAPGESRMIYIPSKLPPLTGFTLDFALQYVSNQVDVLASNYQVDAARALLDQVAELGPLPDEKKLAVLVRLRRMLFLSYANDTLNVKDIRGLDVQAPLAVQQEFVLYHHERRDPALTGSPPFAIDPTNPPVELWDLGSSAVAGVAEGYGDPSPGRQLFEIHVQDELTGSQSRILVDQAAP